MSKDPLDRTLNHNPDRGPDQMADRTLNREPAQTSDRDTEPETGRPVKPSPGPAKKPVAAASKKPAAAPAEKPVKRTGKKPVAAPVKRQVAGGSKKPVASPANKPAAAPSMAPATDSTVVLDRAVEMRSEHRVEVVIPIEMQIVIDVPGTGEIRGATENVSCSGMLARMNGDVPLDLRCEVHFLGKGGIEPERVFARVIRVAKSRFGYAVAFRFENPVRLKVDT